MNSYPRESPYKKAIDFLDRKPIFFSFFGVTFLSFLLGAQD